MEKYVRAKLHGITVTGAVLNYHGSITLDPLHCREIGIRPMEFVDIWNRNSGARLSTYVLYGEPGSRCCILNGAAARTCQPGDVVIIAASSYGQIDDVMRDRPRVLIFDADNTVIDRVTYDVFVNGDGDLDMRVLDTATEESRPIPMPGAAPRLQPVPV